MSTKHIPKGSVLAAGSEIIFEGRQAFRMDHNRLTSRAVLTQAPGSDGRDPTRNRRPLGGRRVA